MFTTVAFRNSKSIHLAAEGTKTICGSETYRTAGSCITKTRKASKVTGEVTCKRCAKIAAQSAPAEAPAPAPEAPAARELKVFYIPSKRTHTAANRAALKAAGIL